MTRTQLQAWIERRYRGKIATAARALGVGRGPLGRLLSGSGDTCTRGATTDTVPRNLELAAAAIELGVDSYDGGPLHIALGDQPLTGL